MAFTLKRYHLDPDLAADSPTAGRFTTLDCEQNNSGTGFEDLSLNLVEGVAASSETDPTLSINTDEDGYLARFSGEPYVANTNVRGDQRPTHGNGAVYVAMGISERSTDTRTVILRTSVYIWNPSGGGSVRGYVSDHITEGITHGVAQNIIGFVGPISTTAANTVAAQSGDYPVVEVLLSITGNSGTLGLHYDGTNDTFTDAEDLGSWFGANSIASFLEWEEEDAAFPEYEAPPPQLLRTVVLEEIKIKKEISKLGPRNHAGITWTQEASPYTNLWYVDCRPLNGDDVTCPVTDVEMTGLQLSPMKSKTRANATDRSWYHDERLGRIWLNPPVNPFEPPTEDYVLDEEIVMAHFVVRYATVPKHLNKFWYEPRLINPPNGFENRLAVNQIFFTEQPKTSGEILHMNADAYYDDMLYDYEWRQGTSRLLYANDRPGAVAAYDDYQEIRNATIENLDYTDDIFTEVLGNASGRLDVPVLQYFFFKEADAEYAEVQDYPDAEDEIVGLPQPLFFGEIEDLAETDKKISKRSLPCFRVKDTNDDNATFWKICAELRDRQTGNTYGPLSVSKVFKGKNVISSGNYTLSESNTKIEFDSGVNVPNKDKSNKITAQIEGYGDDADGTFTGTASARIEKPWDVIHFLAVVIGGYKHTQLDIGSLTDTLSTKQGVAGTFTPPSWYEPVHLYIAVQEDADNINPKKKVVANFGQIQLFDMIQGLALSVGAIFVEGNNGKMTLQRINPLPQNYDLSVTDEDIRDYHEVWASGSMVSRFVVDYLENPQSKTKKKKKQKKKKQVPVAATLVSVRDQYPEANSGLQKEVTLNAFLKTDTNAQELATFWKHMFKRGVIECSFIDVSGQLLAATPGGRIIVHRDRKIGGAGRRVFFVQSVIKNYSNNVVQIEKAIEAVYWE